MTGPSTALTLSGESDVSQVIKQVDFTGELVPVVEENPGAGIVDIEAVLLENPIIGPAMAAARRAISDELDTVLTSALSVIHMGMNEAIPTLTLELAQNSVREMFIGFFKANMGVLQLSHRSMEGSAQLVSSLRTLRETPELQDTLTPNEISAIASETARLFGNMHDFLSRMLNRALPELADKISDVESITVKPRNKWDQPAGQSGGYYSLGFTLVVESNAPLGQNATTAKSEEVEAKLPNFLEEIGLIPGKVMVSGGHNKKEIIVNLNFPYTEEAEA